MRRNVFGPAGVRCAFAAAVAAYAVVGMFSITGHAGQAREVTAGGSYSTAQADRGKQLYTDQCVACHGSPAVLRVRAARSEGPTARSDHGEVGGKSISGGRRESGSYDGSARPADTGFLRYSSRSPLCGARDVPISAVQTTAESGGG